MTVKVKICCISSMEEAQLAIKYGASALGLVSHMPSGPGVISEGLIAEIAAQVPPSVETFLLTSLCNADAIMEQHQRCKTSTLQLVDHVAAAELKKLRQSLPDVQLVQVIHVVDESAVDEATEAGLHVDALLLDSGNPNLAVKELGGTGRVHDWRISRQICEQVDCPVYLAGGLNPANIRQAIEAVRPFGVDLCSGIRSDKRLDETKLSQFIKAVHNLS